MWILVGYFIHLYGAVFDRMCWRKVCSCPAEVAGGTPGCVGTCDEDIVWGALHTHLVLWTVSLGLQVSILQPNSVVYWGAASIVLCQ